MRKPVKLMAKEENESKLITTKIASQILGVTPDYVRRLCQEGKIRAQRLGHDWIFTLADIKYLKEQRKLKKKGL
jgi:excisionase family DNA binding protein